MNYKNFTLLILLCLIFLSCSRTKVIVVDVGNNQINIDTTVLRQTDYEIKLEHLINDGLRIVGIAQRYFEKEVYLGGGGNSFLGFLLPRHLMVTEYGFYSLKSTNYYMTVTCIAKYDSTNSKNGVMVEISATPDKATVVIVRH
jgi:hypothetical protein